MVGVGIVYLAFEDTLLSTSGTQVAVSAAARNKSSRALIGVQVHPKLTLPQNRTLT